MRCGGNSRRLLPSKHALCARASMVRSTSVARTESETPGRELATSSSQHFHRVRLLARSASGRPNVGTASLAFADSGIRVSVRRPAGVHQITRGHSGPNAARPASKTFTESVESVAFPARPLFYPKPNSSRSIHESRMCHNRPRLSTWSRHGQHLSD